MDTEHRESAWTLLSANRDGKDVIADILPPPEYIVESYLTAMQLVDAAELGNRTEMAIHQELIRKLHDEFDVRHDYWVKELTHEEMRELLLEDAYKPGLAFFSIVEKELIAACDRGDVDEAKNILRGPARQS